MLIDNAISAASQSLTAKMAGAKGIDPQRAEATAHDFESLFISQMVEQMFGESIGSDAFGSEDTDEVYKGLMVQEYGKMITQSGGIGIADYVKRELLKQQEM
jgi:flagellar protein FlgJ